MVATNDQQSEAVSFKLRGGDRLRMAGEGHSYRTVWNQKVAGFTLHTFSDDFSQLKTDYISYEGRTLHTFTVKKGAPAPAPGPAPPGPGPAAGCCHFDDAACAPGLVCCKEDCDKEPRQCSYTQWACGGRYGRKHHCEWRQQGAPEGELEGGGVCVVGSGGEAGSSAAEDGAAVAEDGRVATAVEMVVVA